MPFSFGRFRSIVSPPSMIGRPTDAPEPALSAVVSQLCTQAQLDSEEYARWCSIIHETPRYHRKQWEFCYILAALDQAGMLMPGKRGLGFGVGREPIAAVAAARGCQIVATDLDEGAAIEKGWAAPGGDANREHAAALDQVNDRGICPSEDFHRLVSFRPVDMNNIPLDLDGFDFLWSSCALEHLGTLEAGLEFIRRSLDCLRPGGVAVHTTEYNLSSNEDTVAIGSTVLYRRRDIEGLAEGLAGQGHHIELNFTSGSRLMDRYVDVAPYDPNRHLRLEIGQYIATSLGLIIRRNDAGS